MSGLECFHFTITIYFQASDKNQQQHVSESKSSVIPRKVGENSKASLSAPSIRTASKKGNGKVVITPKQRGSLLTKVTNYPITFCFL